MQVQLSNTTGHTFGRGAEKPGTGVWIIPPCIEPLTPQCLPGFLADKGSLRLCRPEKIRPGDSNIVFGSASRGTMSGTASSVTYVGTVKTRRPR